MPRHARSTIPSFACTSCAILFDKKRRRVTPRSLAKVAVKTPESHFPGLSAAFAATAEAVRAAADRLALFGMLQGTCAALTVADWLIARYEELKSARGFLDFNDLITRTVRLLSRQDAGQWVHYKLDRGIDHILIDEAQDTSPAQWQVVKDLAAEFFAGAGAGEERRRTLFAVGDEKQSIYSFQGADPASFAESGDAFAGRVRAAGQPFERLRLTWSFRSTEDVLSAVDRVFARPHLRQGLGRDRDPIEHARSAPAPPAMSRSGRRSAPRRSRSRTTGASRSTMRGRRPCSLPSGSRPPSPPGSAAAKGIGGDRQAGAGRQYAGAGAQARPVRPCAVAQPEGTRHPGRRRRPAEPARPISRSRTWSRSAVSLLQPHDDLSLAARAEEPGFRPRPRSALRRWPPGGPRASLYAALRGKAVGDLWFAAAAERLAGWMTEAAFRPAVRVLCRRAATRDGVRASDDRPPRAGSRRHSRRVPELLLAEERIGAARSGGLSGRCSTTPLPRSSARWTKAATRSAS